MSSSQSFQEACEKAKHLKKDPGNEIKLNMYALFKQASEGPCKQAKPSVFDLVGKAKWEAWNSLGNMTQEEAKKKYMDLVDKLNDTEENTKETNNMVLNSKYEGMTVTVTSHITEIKFNRPAKKNAITTQMYKDMVLALKEASENETPITILTGEGDYFCSGNDLSNFTKIEGDVSVAAQNAARMLNDFVGAFIDFPKILVAAVNGPAIGLAVTILGLCDVVYASDNATFLTPFSSLGQTPEGCSTYTFPKIMGLSKANEILIFGKKMTASEAMSCGLVSEVFPRDKFSECVQNKLSFLSSASKQSMVFSKELIRKKENKILHEVNDEECQRLVERWQSADCMEALMRFFSRKSKL